MTFLPDGRLWVSEKAGNLRLIDANETVSKPLENMLEVKYAQQGGLLDVTIDPNFGENLLIYFSYSKSIKNRHSVTAVVKSQIKQC